MAMIRSYFQSVNMGSGHKNLSMLLQVHEKNINYFALHCTVFLSVMPNKKSLICREGFFCQNNLALSIYINMHEDHHYMGWIKGNDKTARRGMADVCTF